MDYDFISKERDGEALWGAVHDFHRLFRALGKCTEIAKSGSSLTTEQKAALEASLQEFERNFKILKDANLIEAGDEFPRERKMIHRYLHDYTTWFPALYHMGVITREEMKRIAPQFYEIGENPRKYPDPDARTDTLRSRWEIYSIQTSLTTGRRASCFGFVIQEVKGLWPK